MRRGGFKRSEWRPIAGAKYRQSCDDCGEPLPVDLTWWWRPPRPREPHKYGRMANAVYKLCDACFVARDDTKRAEMRDRLIGYLLPVMLYGSLKERLQVEYDPARLIRRAGPELP